MPDGERTGLAHGRRVGAAGIRDAVNAINDVGPTHPGAISLMVQVLPYNKEGRRRLVNPPLLLSYCPVFHSRLL